MTDGHRSAATAAHVPFDLPDGVCLFCGVATSTPRYTRPLAGLSRGVDGAVCLTCHHAWLATGGDLTAFLTARLATAFPDPSVLPRHVVRAASGPPGRGAVVTWGRPRT